MGAKGEESAPKRKPENVVRALDFTHDIASKISPFLVYKEKAKWRRHIPNPTKPKICTIAFI